MTHTRNKPNQQIFDEAAEWFVDFREGDLNAAAQQAFSQWLRRSPEHISAYMEVAAFWADVPNFVPKENVDVSALIAYAQAEDNIVPLAVAGRTSRHEHAKPADSAITRTITAPATPAPALGSWRRGGVLLAASFAIAAVGIGSWWSLTQRNTYRTDVGQQFSLLLEDGSTVELNAKSRLRVRFTDEARNIELLEGQALFRVTKDPLRPFVVSSGDASVRAVGTQFDVYRRKTGTTVTVIEGKVAVVNFSVPTASRFSTSEPLSKRAENSDNPDVRTAHIFLSAGEQIVVSMKMPALPKPVNIPVATAWTQRQIVFQGAPLGDVVEEFNRYNPRQMKVLDETLQTVRVSGVFSSTEPASLLRFLREQVHLEVTEGDESIRISRK